MADQNNFTNFHEDPYYDFYPMDPNYHYNNPPVTNNDTWPESNFYYPAPTDSLPSQCPLPIAQQMVQQENDWQGQNVNFNGQGHYEYYPVPEQNLMQMGPMEPVNSCMEQAGIPIQAVENPMGPSPMPLVPQYLPTLKPKKKKRSNETPCPEYLKAAANRRKRERNEKLNIAYADLRFKCNLSDKSTKKETLAAAYNYIKKLVQDANEIRKINGLPEYPTDYDNFSMFRPVTDKDLHFVESEEEQGQEQAFAQEQMQEWDQRYVMQQDESKNHNIEPYPNTVAAVVKLEPAIPKIKKKRGRPKGSVNKK